MTILDAWEQATEQAANAVGNGGAAFAQPGLEAGQPALFLFGTHSAICPVSPFS